MFHWEILILPLIAFGVWILSTVFKSEDDKTRTGSRGPEGAMGRRIPRRPRPQERSRTEPAPRREVPEATQPRPSPPPITAPRRPTVPVPGVPGQRRRAPILATVIDEPPPVVRQPPAIVRPPEPPPILLPMPTAVLESLPAPAVALPEREKAPSPVIQEVLRLLRSPKSAASAFVIREILDRRFGPRRR
jgi:hypothetical protein